jgi:hypothetical protein
VLLSCHKDSPSIPDSIIVSCEKRTNKIDSVKQLIAGTYSWLYTHVLDRGVDFIESPVSTGIKKKYVFDDKGTVKYFEDNKLISDNDYTIEYELNLSGYYLDSTVMVIANDIMTKERKYYFIPYL